MNLSRRQFFERLRGRVAPGNATLCWITIGSIADFPPEAQYTLAEHNVIVRSEPEGVRVIDAASGEHRPVRLERDGKLSFQPGANWPDESALSILTGERIQLEGSHHE